MSFGQYNISILLLFFLFSAVSPEVRAEGDVGGKRMFLPAYANADLKLGATTDFNVCDEFATDFVFTVLNESNRTAFPNGVYFVDWGDGTGVQNVGDFTGEVAHTYARLGDYSIRFSVKMNGVEQAFRAYPVSKLARPGGGLGMGPSGVPCIDSDAEVKITGYEENSTGTTYQLNFGDNSGIVSITQQEVVRTGGIVKHRYVNYDCRESGVLSINLTVTNRCNFNFGASIPSYTIVSPPAVDFVFPDKNCAGEPVQFSNTTEAGRNANCDTLTNFMWDFDLDGDGVFETHSKLRDPKITYPKEGSYLVRLTGENGPVCSRKTEEKRIRILQSVKIKWHVTPSSTICEGKSVTLDATASAGEEKEYYWNVIEGDPGACKFTPNQNSPNPQVQFTRFGTYKLQLYLTNGCSDDVRDTVINVNKDPEIIRFDALTAICPSTYGTGLLNLGGKVGYVWYNNEVKPTWTITPATGWSWVAGYNANSLTPQVKFTVPGDYTLTVSVKGVGCGATAAQLQKSQVLKVYDPAIDLNILVDGDKTEVCEQDEIRFTNSSTGGQEIKYQWIILKSGVPARLNTDYVFTGGSATDKAPKLKFLLYGDYSVTANLAVECNAASKTFPFHVKKEPEITRFDPLAAICPSVTGHDGVLRMGGKVAYEWYNNTGMKPTWEITPATGWEWVTLQEKNKEYPNVKFTLPGTYTVKVSIPTAGCGGTKLEKSQTIKIYDPAIVKNINIKGALSSICEGENIVMENATVAENPVYAWAITRDGGGSVADYSVTPSASAAAPAITFNRFGSYTVRVGITAQCATDFQEFPLLVKKDPAIVQFDNLAMGCKPHVLNMRGVIRYEWYNNAEHKLNWTIEGPAGGAEYVNSNAQSEFPIIKFSDPGTYRLTVKLDNAGCHGTKLEQTREIIILDPSVKKDITIKDESSSTVTICENDEVTFVNNTQSVIPVTYSWVITSKNDVYPDKGYRYTGGSATDPAPKITFSRYGVYTVIANLTTDCNQGNPTTETFIVTVQRDPEVTMMALSAICPADVLTLDNEKVTYKWNDNTAEVVFWEVTRVDGNPAEGVAFDETALYPEIKFTHPGTYKVSVNLEQPAGCGGTALNANQTVVVHDPAMNLLVEAENAVICEGTKAVFKNTSTFAEPVTYLWSVVPVGSAPADGWEAFTVTDAKPAITFTHYGKYKVKVVMTGSCGKQEKEMEITVQKDPSVLLRDFPDMCPGELILASEGDFTWRDNAQSVNWTVNTLTGSGTATGDLSGLYPVVTFPGSGTYEIIAGLTSVGCPGADLSSRKVLTVFPPDIKVDVQLPAEVEEGESLTVVNRCIGEIKSYQWSFVQGPAGGAEFVAPTNGSSKEPEIRFTKFGEYRIKLFIDGTCTDSTKYFDVVVKGIPEYHFQEFKNICAGTTLKMEDYLECEAKGSTITASWTITPSGSEYYEYMNAGGKDALLPVIHFKKNGHYTMVLEADAEFGGKQVFTKEINVLTAEVTAVTLLDLAGCTDLDVELENHSTGDSLQYEWTITPADGGWHYTSGSATGRQPSVRFTQRENYRVELRVANICDADVAAFSVRAYSKPAIDAIADVRDVCERGYVFKGSEVVKVDDNGDAINYTQWSVSPAGYQFVNSTGQASLKPDIIFEGGAVPYLLKLEVGNGCAERVSREFTILVDDFEDIEPLRDTAVCALTAPMLLKAEPDGGRWTATGTGMIDSVDINEWYFNPHRDLTETFEVVYSRGHMSCIAHDTMNVVVHKLPVVDAGEDLGRCLNLPPLELGGRNPAGGTWKGNGVATGAFDPSVPGVGDWKIEYWYTDPLTGCPNLDTIIMTVHPLPDAVFKTAGEHCRNTDSLFIPNAPLSAGNTYEWDFGDGTVPLVSAGQISYQYGQPGFYNVVMTATSPKGCILSSAPKRIEVFNLPPPAEFTMDKQEGCGPLYVKFYVDPAHYNDPSAHLSYTWLFGNGESSDELQPAPDVRTFVPMPFDTTYQVKFEVYNICRTETQVKDLRVFSSPEPYFLMSPDEGCSPLEVSFINLSKGTGNRYKWTLGDGKVSTEKNPRNTYTAGGRANFYEIVLNAENRCAAYEFKDTLMVKPNTLNAVFRVDRRYICTGDMICFTNYSSDTSTAILSQRWEFGDGQFSPAWDTCHRYDISGKMGVSLLVDNGCAKGVFTDTVTVFPIPVLKIESEEKLCEDDTFHFELKSDQPLKNISWEFGDGGKGNALKQRHIYQDAGIYEAIVKVVSAEIASCPSQASRSVEAWPKPDVKILPLDTVVCSPYLYQPDLIGEGYFKWDYGTGDRLTSENEHLYVNDTNYILDYDIVAYVESNRGCREEYKGHIKLYNGPEARLDKDISYGRPEKVTFINLSRDYTECIWYLPDGRIVNSPDDQTLVFEQESDYPLSLVAVNQYGCRDSLFMGHKSYMSGLFFPNSFIPHSSNPKVNTFKGVGMGLKEYSLAIFDMYGNKVWESNALLYGEPAEGWDGRNSKGEPLPQGVYMWRARAIFFSEDVWTGKNNGSGKEQATQGTVLLMRE